jgi:hydroxybutyrate-dimer hydrolase
MMNERKTANSVLRTVMVSAFWAAVPVGVLAGASADTERKGAGSPVTVNTWPEGLRGPFTEAVYDGVSDDLLTAGLGVTGLMGSAPVYVNASAPTAAELRRNAIYNNYRALVDITASGGMSRLYGPNIDISGQDTLGQGRVAGREYIAWADEGNGRRNVTVLVQLPDTFDVNVPCIVSATSSGSRGIYGAIATAGEWGLKHGCAVAYTDKGTGNGFHDLMTDTVTARDGTLLQATTAGKEALFKASIRSSDQVAFNAATPYRVAYKHAHSLQNPERDWGRATLDAIRFAFYVLNERYGTSITSESGATVRHAARFGPANTLVIASSVSNGGGAALAAAEQDTQSLIDAVVVSEPNAQPQDLGRVRIQQGSTVVPVVGRPLIDYFTFADVYQPCALLSSQTGLSMSSSFWPATYTTAAQQRCAALAARGLVLGSSLSEWADDAWARMRAYGWTADSAFLQQSHFRFATNSIAMTYANALGRFSVLDNLCGFSFANTDSAGVPVAQVASTQAGLFASGNGIPPTSGVNIVYNKAVGGATLDFLAASPTSGVADFALDGALCLRTLVTGRDLRAGKPLGGRGGEWHNRLSQGVDEVRLSGQLRGKPTLIVAGRSDALLPVNHAARAYFARNQAVDRQASRVRYIEVTNAQHFDSFIAYGALLGYDTRFIPLHVYFDEAMDRMWAYLRQGTALPASQVVRTTPRTSSGEQVTRALMPAIATLPAAGDAIQYSVTGRMLLVPD